MGDVGRKKHVVIVGGGLAGAKTAESLRGWGFDGRVTIVGEEPCRPYQRPPLSKSYLRGRSGFEDAAVHPEKFYESNDIDLLTSTRVLSIDPRSRTVGLSGNAALHWDHLVLATGARARHWKRSGAELDGVLYLRSIEDADAIRTRIEPGARAVVLGAGWVGTEVAASIRRLGIEVAMVYRSAVPFESTMGPAVGAAVADVHRSNGVELYPSSVPVALRGSRHVEAVELEDGRLLAADFVVAGVGAEPADELALAAGLDVEVGVLTDAQLRASAHGVFAVGDVAAIDHPLFDGRVRSHHWWSALTQPPTVAANIVGVPAVYDWVPTFTSKQYDLMLEHTGHAPRWDSIVVRGDVSQRRFVAFWMLDGTVVAGLTAGIAGLEHQIRSLVAGRRRVDPRALADPGTGISDLLTDKTFPPR